MKYNIRIEYQPAFRILTQKMSIMDMKVYATMPDGIERDFEELEGILTEEKDVLEFNREILDTFCMEIDQQFSKGDYPSTPYVVRFFHLDYLSDLFVEEIEEATKDVSLPRDIFLIAIREKNLIKNKKTLERQILAMHELGYPTLLDMQEIRFGTATVMEEFQFSFVQIDVANYHPLTVYGEAVLRNTIRTLKEMKLLVFAKNVEYQEQFDLLRKNNCEFAQGDFFDKWQELGAFQKLLHGDEEVTETRALRKYYDMVNQSSGNADLPLGILELVDTDFHFLSGNQLFYEELSKIKNYDGELLLKSIQTKTSYYYNQLYEYVSRIKVGKGADQLICTMFGRFIKVEAKCVASFQERSAYVLEIHVLRDDDMELKVDSLDSVYRAMYPLYDSVFLLDPETKKYKYLMEVTGVRNLEVPKDKTISNMISTLRNHVHPNDRLRFDAFLEPESLMERIQMSHRGGLSTFVRMENSKGAYVWKILRLVYLADQNMVIYSVSETLGMSPNLLQDIQEGRSNVTRIKMESDMEEALKKGLMDSRNVHLFWKDKDRRFLGANDKFLETYGFSDVSQILGKTDEDMGWHVDNHPFRDDELRVLENGELIQNQVGTCVIKGINHRILVNKEPLYENGEIVGLMGQFVIVDEIQNDHRGETTSLLKDSDSGLMTVQSMANVVAEYIDNYMARKEDFAIIRVSILDYFRAINAYGEPLVKKMLYEFGQVLLECAGPGAICGRAYFANFVLLLRCEDKNKINQIDEYIHEKARLINQLASYPVTIRVRSEVFFASESNNVQDLISVASYGIYSDAFAKQRFQNEQVKSIIDQYLDYAKSSLDNQLHTAVSKQDLVVVSDFQRNLIDSIAGTYETLHAIDLEEDSYFEIVCDEQYHHLLEGIQSAREARNLVFQYVLKDSEYEEMREFCDLCTLSDRMKDQDIISHDYESKVKGWCRGSFISLTRREDGTLKEVLYGVQHIADEKKREERQESIITALARGFLNVYLVNPVTNQARTLKLQGYTFPGQVADTRQFYSFGEVSKIYVERRVYEADKALMLDALSPDGMKRILTEHQEYNLPYRVMENGEICYYQAKFVRLEETKEYLIAFQNIDELMQEQNRRQKELQETLIKANKANFAKTNFLSHMSHDIRTPMNGIVGMTRMAIENIENPEKAKDYLSKVQISSKRLEALINDVLEMTRLERGTVELTSEVVDMRKLTEECLLGIEIIAQEKGVRLEDVHYEMEHSVVRTSPVHCQRILSNLLSNAIKYNKTNGSVGVWLREEKRDENRSDYVLIVNDTGVGMSEEFMKNLFRPFSRENNQKSSRVEGTGLGMAITKELVELMGGTIEVDSKKNIGTTFTVRLPLEHVKPEEHRMREEGSLDISGTRVLLVEDNEMNMEITKYILSQQGVLISTAFNGEEAVELFQNSSENSFDIVLMDVMMPILDGLGATKRIRALDRQDAKEIPIIATTANAFQEDRQECLDAGMTDHLSKPIKAKELVDIIAKYAK